MPLLTAGKLVLILFVYHIAGFDVFYVRLDRAVVARYFAFLVISQLIIFTLIGVGFSEDFLWPLIVVILIALLQLLLNRS